MTEPRVDDALSTLDEILNAEGNWERLTGLGVIDSLLKLRRDLGGEDTSPLITRIYVDVMTMRHATGCPKATESPKRAACSICRAEFTTLMRREVSTIGVDPLEQQRRLIGEQVANVPLVGLGPQMPVGFRVRRVDTTQALVIALDLNPDPLEANNGGS